MLFAVCCALVAAREAIAQPGAATLPVAVQPAHGASCNEAPPGSYYLEGDCTPVALDACAKPGVAEEFVDLLNGQARLRGRVVRIEHSRVRLTADSDDAAHRFRDDRAHHSEMMPPTRRVVVGG